MDSRAEDALQAGGEDGVVVEIFPEVLARFFGVDEAHFAALADKVSQQAEKGFVPNVKVLDVGGANPKVMFDARYERYDIVKVGFVCDVSCHNTKGGSSKQKPACSGLFEKT